jgi:hypothetical protein
VTRTHLVLFLSLAAAGQLWSAPPDDLERQRLIAHFEMTESWLADEVANLSPEQLKFRPSPNAWNILDCVEHLDLAEAEYWKMLQSSMAAPASRKLSKSTDIDRMWYGIDRRERAKTVPSETPKSTYPSIEAALKDFRAQRATMLTYARTSQEDWRHHMIPDWNRDAYQWLLMISAHSQRHILQIRENKHDAAYPH